MITYAVKTKLILYYVLNGFLICLFFPELKMYLNDNYDCSHNTNRNDRETSKVHVPASQWNDTKVSSVSNPKLKRYQMLQRYIFSPS
jgi:hypothetical protein